MTVGLPGTGIGGLYYLTLALAMPLRETWRALRGRSSASRWRVVGVQLGITVGILALLWGQAWLLGLLARSISRARPNGYLAAALGKIVPDGAWVFSHAGAAGLAVLGLILIGVHAARLLVRRPTPTPPLPGRREPPPHPVPTRTIPASFS